jgi:hypothetical protein
VFKKGSYQTIIIILFGVMWLNVFSYTKEYTKEFYFKRDYVSFEEYIFEKKNLVNLRHNKFVGEKGVKRGAKMFGYDDFAIQRIPLSYSLFDRSDDDIKKILNSLGSDECIYYINILIEKTKQAAGDLNLVMRIVHDEGERLKKERIDATGYAPSQLEEDTFIAAGLLIRYLIKNKLV